MKSILKSSKPLILALLFVCFTSGSVIAQSGWDGESALPSESTWESMQETSIRGGSLRAGGWDDPGTGGVTGDTGGKDDPNAYNDVIIGDGIAVCCILLIMYALLKCVRIRVTKRHLGNAEHQMSKSGAVKLQ